MSNDVELLRAAIFRNVDALSDMSIAAQARGVCPEMTAIFDDGLFWKVRHWPRLARLSTTATA